MEKKENKECEYVIDDSVFRVCHTIDKSLVTADDFTTLKDSPLTKSLCKILEYYCIIPAIGFNNNGDINVHVIGKFDIKKAILERELNKRKNGK